MSNVPSSSISRVETALVISMKAIATEIIDTEEQICDLVDWLVLRHASPVPYSPTMYIDLEGVNLCREGYISIFTLLIDTGIPTTRACLIDVHSLGRMAFETAGANGKTLKDILQDEQITKVFFDVRNDSDAMYAHFDISLQGIEDVQLMESATRKTTRSRKWLNGLAKCVDEYVLPYESSSERVRWKQAKKRGETLFKIDQGGSQEIFNKRPLPKDVTSYCVGDVQYLPDLRKKFWLGQTVRWQQLVAEESKKRVMASRKKDYQPHSPNKTMSPWSQIQNNLLDSCN